MTKPTHPSYRYANVDAKPQPGDRVSDADGRTGTVKMRHGNVSAVVVWDNGDKTWPERIKFLDRI